MHTEYHTFREILIQFLVGLARNGDGLEVNVVELVLHQERIPEELVQRAWMDSADCLAAHVAEQVYGARRAA